MHSHLQAINVANKNTRALHLFIFITPALPTELVGTSHIARNGYKLQYLPQTETYANNWVNSHQDSRNAGTKDCKTAGQNKVLKVRRPTHKVASEELLSYRMGGSISGPTLKESLEATNGGTATIAESQVAGKSPSGLSQWFPSLWMPDFWENFPLVNRVSKLNEQKALSSCKIMNFLFIELVFHFAHKL